MRPLARAFLDVTTGLDRCLASGPRGLALTALGLVAGWWIYVPIHELLHAAGCLALGGEVTRLDIAPMYGGRLLARLFPFVAASAGKAGRLSGFDTGGSDLVYLATDLAPFVLTVFPGVWALRAAGGAGRSLAFGFAIPFALAPFVSIGGDAYEIGSILVTNLPLWSAEPLQATLRGDDLVERIATVRSTGGFRAWSGLVVATLVGIVWALGTYLIGVAVAEAVRQARMPSSSILRRRVER